MDFLKAEIARKKEQLQKADVLVENKKYFKRGDLAAKQEEEYWKKHKRLKTENCKEEEEQNDLTEEPSTTSKEDTDKVQMSLKEIIRKLRERGEPIRLFAESDYDVYLRMKKLEMLAPEINKGMENDMKTAMDRVDQDYMDELMESAGVSDSNKSQAHNVKTKDDGTTLQDIMKLAENFGKGDYAVDQEVILRFCKMILNMWGTELNSRNETEKRSVTGKLQAATHSQTVTYIKPLFKKLKNQSVPVDILECLVEICKYLLDRHYIKANDAYLEMAIGNAPWPIGVTMVGIHARTGREKIFAKNVAHVLNDETQRKYIQALKRLMTKCQQFFPTVPSRSVNYESQTKSVL